MKGYSERAVVLLEGYTSSKFKLALSLINHMIEMETETLREEMFDLEHLPEEERRGRKYPFEDNYFEILTKAVGLYEEERKYKAHELFAILALAYVSDLELQSADRSPSNAELASMGFVVEAVMLAEAIAKVPKTVDQLTAANKKRQSSRKGAKERIKSLKLDEEKRKGVAWYEKNHRLFKNALQASKRAHGDVVSHNVPENTVYKWFLGADKQIKKKP